ncbi:MAG: MBL fold metallo-hydrolase [Chromatiaceae bacterium]|nr:MBL fold metallo-hydrolase [Gammaproteobacteria bacterium]MCP5305870.1 MBL fold metallo-hydrolase [Chromatiaceae bacterium]MCP5312726.1 MBL fold metallo-hydrolase [Chromatiaceae bacterium]
MQIRIIPVTSFEQNCSLLCCPTTGKAALVDPGGDPDRILAAVRDAEVSLQKIFVTHGHFDHVGAVAQLAEALALPIEGPQEADRFLLDSLPEWCRQFGFPPSEAFVPDRWLVDGDTVEFGEQRLQVRHCPGHTPGHVIFFHPVDRVAMVGDVIFQGSIGRTDFPRGDLQALLTSIRERIWSLGDDVTLLPGHGPVTTVGEERAHNPFLQGGYG